MYVYPIFNHTELWAKMESIRYWSELLESMSSEQKDRFDLNRQFELERVRERIRNAKRSVRKFLREERETEPAHLVHNDFDSCIWLIPMPEFVKDAEAAEVWFQLHEYMPIVNSAYDCTGRHFTSWYKIVNRGGRFYAYHCESIDV